MATKKKPKYDEVLDGVRVRVYATRAGYEIVYNDDDIDDPNANVMIYPKVGPAEAWATQGRLEYVAPDVRACRQCGCTDEKACVDEAGTPCSWVEPDLCSACA